MRSHLARLAAASLVCLLGGCATVEPWQRGTLAADRMQLEPNADEASLELSRRRTREEGIVQGGSTSATSGGGGGCGCH